MVHVAPYLHQLSLGCSYLKDLTTLVHPCNPPNQPTQVAHDIPASTLPAPFPCGSDATDTAGLQPDCDLLWWKALYRQMPAICFILNEVGCVVQVSQQAARRLGYEADALLGKPFASLVVVGCEEVARTWFGWLQLPQAQTTWQTTLQHRDSTTISLAMEVQVVRQGNRVAVILMHSGTREKRSDRPPTRQTNAQPDTQPCPIQDGSPQQHLAFQLHCKSQREQLLNQIIGAMGRSLDLDSIFRTAANEVGHLLHLDRAQVAQYTIQADAWWIRYEYRSQESMPALQGQKIAGKNNPLSDQLKRLESAQVHTLELQDSINQVWAQQAPGRWLLVPLVVDEQVWGCLFLNRVSGDLAWQDWEVELAETITDPLAIAIQQAELFRQVSHLNRVLETTVQERTAQLTRSLQYESLVRRITDRVRDSLDESHILQTAVQELLNELQLECCDAGIYNLETQTSTIAYEFTGSLAPARHTVIPMVHYPHIYRQLFGGISFQFCDIQPSKPRQKSYRYAMLVCSIYDDQGALGDLWLFRPNDQCFDILEVRLVEQIASQCAIALRQSRLYNAAQRQVEELAKLNQLKDDFLSTVSHELRSPMANIKMATEMLELYLTHTEIFLDEKARSAQYFRILRDECERESTLINDLLDLSRLEADSEPLMCHTLDLYDWILHISEVFLHRTESHHQHLEFDLPPDIPPLSTDFTFLERILTELLHNACKYTPAGERITLSLRFLPPLHPTTSPDPVPCPLPSHCYWEITIANTGIEIPPTEQARIFDKFYRVPNNDPWRTGGTGLGLALVKKRVERLGGQIQVVSANQRTAFVIKLPCLI